jgi:hypothetical protein
VKTADIWKSYLDHTLGANEAQQALKERASRTADSLIAMIQLDRNAGSILKGFRVPAGAEDRIVKMIETANLPDFFLSSKDSLSSPPLDFILKLESAMQPEVVGAGALDSNESEAKGDEGKSADKR